MKVFGHIIVLVVGLVEALLIFVWKGMVLLIHTNQQYLLLKKEGIKCDASLVIKAAKEARIKTDSQKTINLSHFVACENLRRLLRMCNRDKETMLWVSKAFSRMNDLLDDPNVNPTEFDKFREESFIRMQKIT